MLLCIKPGLIFVQILKEPCYRLCGITIIVLMSRDMIFIELVCIRFIASGKTKFVVLHRMPSGLKWSMLALVVMTSIIELV